MEKLDSTALEREEQPPPLVLVGWEALAGILRQAGKASSVSFLKTIYRPHGYYGKHAIFLLPALDWTYDDKERNWRPKTMRPGRRVVLDELANGDWGWTEDGKTSACAAFTVLLDNLAAAIVAGSVSRFRVLEPTPPLRKSKSMRISQRVRDRERERREGRMAVLT